MLDEVGSAVVGAIFWSLLESRLGWLITIPLLAVTIYVMFYVHFTGGLVFFAFALAFMALQIRGTARRHKSRKESSIND